MGLMASETPSNDNVYLPGPITLLTSGHTLSVGHLLALHCSGAGGWVCFRFSGPIRWLPTVGGKDCISASIRATKSGCPAWFIGEMKSPTCQACSQAPPCAFCSTPPTFLCCWHGTLQLSQKHAWSSLLLRPKPKEQKHRMFQTQISSIFCKAG